MKRDDTLKLMSDYGAESPLWSADGMVSPADLGLSPDLDRALVAWQEQFELHFDPDDGWDSTERKDRYAREAQELLAALRDELGATYHIALDLWPAMPSADD